MGSDNENVITLPALIVTVIVVGVGVVVVPLSSAPTGSTVATINNTNVIPTTKRFFNDPMLTPYLYF